MESTAKLAILTLKKVGASMFKERTIKQRK